VRIPFRWERLQPALGQPLDPFELARLRDVVARAHRAGMTCILDMHNFGGYYLADPARLEGVRRTLGARALPLRDFADVWSRISEAFAGNQGVAGYGLMNEPVAMQSVGRHKPAQVWEAASQAAVNAIRRRGDTTLVMVAGYEWSKVSRFAFHHPRAWIRDPADHVRYEAHQYFAHDLSGRYAPTYDQELARIPKEAT
jgi:endoglucanase